MYALFGFLTTLILFVIVLIVLVVAHELGHFFTAKFFGVNVEEFGVGYPPRAKKLFVWKGTLFTLNWLPFGGFVKIFGEENETEGSSALTNSFAHQHLWKRLFILAGGIIVNIIFAVVLYTTVFLIGFSGSASDFPSARVVVPPQLTVTLVLADSPAALAGIKVGDKIGLVSVASDDVSQSVARPEEFIEFVRSHTNVPITIELLRENSTTHNLNPVTITVTPKANVIDGKPGIGAGIDMVSTLRLGFWDALKAGFGQTITEFKMILGSIGSLIGAVFVGNGAILSQLSGPIGIAKFGGAAASAGFSSFLAFMAIISINLAVVNLLPFPALDGGRMVLELFARKGKSKISPKIANTINQIGFLLLILLMLVVTYQDIRHVL